MDIEKNKSGFAIISGDSLAMNNAINNLMDNIYNFNDMKEGSWNFLNRYFHVNRSFKLIMQSKNKKLF